MRTEPGSGPAHGVSPAAELGKRAPARVGRRFTILYDENCPMCRASVRAVVRLAPGGTFDVVGLRSPQAAELIPEESARERLEAFHLIAPTGQRWKGDAALPVLFELIRPLWPLAALLRRSPVAASAARSGYRWVSRNRPRISPLLPRSWSRPLSADRPE